MELTQRLVSSEAPTWNISPAQDGNPVLAADSVSAYYPLSKERALDNVTFQLLPGELVALIGPNGAGKSTLFNILSGVIRKFSGTLTIGGTSLLQQRKSNFIAYVPQEGQIDWDYPILVRDVVTLGLYGQVRGERWQRLFGLSDYSKDHRHLAEKALQAVDMESLADRDIKALSGGQKKRVFLARALAQNPRLLLLDEPLAGVDQRSEDLIMNVLTKMTAAGVTVFMASHDIAGAKHYANRVLLLNKRIVKMGSPQEVITKDALGRVFGRSLHFF